MDAEGIAEFNDLKAENNRDLYPVTIEFIAAKGTPYVCAFGESRNDGGLHGSGQIVQNHETGALYWPKALAYFPKLMAIFRITACASDAALVNTTWKLMERRSAAHEPVVKFECVKQEG